MSFIFPMLRCKQVSTSGLINFFCESSVKTISAFYFARKSCIICVPYDPNTTEEIFREAEWSLNEEKWIWRGNKCGKKSYGFSFVWKCIFSNSAICIPATLFRKTVVKAAIKWESRYEVHVTRSLGRLFFFFRASNATRISSPSWCINRLRGSCSDERTCA